MKSPVGLTYENEAKPLKVAMATKKQTPQITREERRRNCHEYSEKAKAVLATYPKGHRCSILVELESDETIDENTPVQCAQRSCIYSREPLKPSACFDGRL